MLSNEFVQYSWPKHSAHNMLANSPTIGQGFLSMVWECLLTYLSSSPFNLAVTMKKAMVWGWISLIGGKCRTLVSKVLLSIGVRVAHYICHSPVVDPTSHSHSILPLFLVLSIPPFLFVHSLSPFPFFWYCPSHSMLPPHSLLPALTKTQPTWLLANSSNLVSCCLSMVWDCLMTYLYPTLVNLTALWKWGRGIHWMRGRWRTL